MQKLKKWYFELFEFIFKNQVSEVYKKDCIFFQNLIALIGSLIFGVLGMFEKLKPLSIILFVLSVWAYIGTQHIINLIDNIEQQESKKTLEKLKDVVSENESLKNKLSKLERKKQYIDSLYTETKMLVTAIRKTNKDKSTKTLYPKITDSIVQLILDYRDIKKENFSVHLYAYDEQCTMVRRVDVQSFVDTKQAADTNEPRSINDEGVKERYYAQALLSQKTFFVLSNLEEIRKHLAFPSNDEDIISQHSQYVAMVYKVGQHVKLYVEIISYNGMTFGKDGDELKKFAQNVIAPFSTLLAMVNWDAIRRDLA